MTNHPVSAGGGWRSLVTLAWAVPVYWLQVFPAATWELRRWRRLAARIPDPQLRRFAQEKLDVERSSAEGAAAAPKAPRPSRSSPHAVAALA
jgi:tetraprenyl-beta-curcumene synthase